MRRAMAGAVMLAVLSLSGCGALVSASIEAGFRELQDDGHHPVYKHQSYGRHFVDALLEEDPQVEVRVQTGRRR